MIGGGPGREGSLRSKPQSPVDRSKLRFCLAAELATSRASRERSVEQSSPSGLRPVAPAQQDRFATAL
jgi:hypothetical protein